MCIALGCDLRIAAGPPIALHCMKENPSRALQLELRSALAMKADRTVRCTHAEDHNEAVQAFMAERKPDFRGRRRRVVLARRDLTCSACKPPLKPLGTWSEPDDWAGTAAFTLRTPMSDKTLEFHLEFGSPAASVTCTQVPRIARQTGASRLRRHGNAMFLTMGVTPRNLGGPAPLAAVLAEVGCDAADFMALFGDAEVKADLAARTEASVAGGACIAPTLFVGRQTLSGRGRLDLVREALAAA